jgi:hypothetical protein
MGLLPQVTRLMLREHNRKPIAGKFLFVARQTTYTTEAQAARLLEQEGVPLNESRKVVIDADTRATKASQGEYITDASLLSFFSTASVESLDLSAYENAAIICDLNKPAPTDLHQRFDFIYNGSCLDNVFNPAQAVINLSSMLSTGGRILHLEHGTRLNNPYLQFNPAWFLDYYTLNCFRRCDVFVAAFKRLESAWTLFKWSPHLPPNHVTKADWGFMLPDINHFMVLVLAERSEYSTTDRIPTQAQYRSQEEQIEIEKNYALMHGNMLRSERQLTHAQLLSRVVLRTIAARNRIGKLLSLRAGLWPNFEFIGKLYAV